MSNSPGTLEITTTIGCRIRCTYCPQELLVRRYLSRSSQSTMSRETFKSCIDKVPLDVGIHYSGMSEPWLNQDCTEMVLYAAGRGHQLAVYTTLVGMTLEDFERIKRLDFKTFVVHLPDEHGNSKIVVDETYRAVLGKVVQHFGSAGRLKNFGVSCHGELRHDITSLVAADVLTSQNSQGFFNQLIDRAGYLSGAEVPHQHHYGPLQCGLSGRHFNRNVLLPDGSVLLCCMDYGMSLVLGNLLETSYAALFRSRTFTDFHAALDGDVHVLCRRCHNAVPWERPYDIMEAQPLLQDVGSPLVLRFSAFLASRIGAPRIAVFPPDRSVSFSPRETSTAVAVLPDVTNLLDHPDSPSWSALARLCESVPAAVVCKPRPGFEALDATERQDETRRFAAALRERGMIVDLAGWALPDEDAACMVAVLSRCGGRPAQPAPEQFKVVALMVVRNEADVIAPVIERLVADGIDVYLIDNWSTDGTYEIAQSYRGRGLVGLERFPPEGPGENFLFYQALQRKEQLGMELDADWFIHHDADEIRESPWPEVGLKDALYRVDQEGYNCVDFTVLNFRPVDDSYSSGSKLEPHFRYFEFGMHPAHFVMVKAWKKSSQRVVLAESGGHKVDFPTAKVYPYKFLLRHYPIRSQQQGVRKIFSERKPRWELEKNTRGWHTHYDHVEEGQNLLAQPCDLLSFDESFSGDYFIERISGLGITPDTNRFPKPSRRHGAGVMSACTSSKLSSTKS